MYDNYSVLRIEATINNPSELRICYRTDDSKLWWKPIGKEVSNLYRYAQVGLQANQHFLDHLTQEKLKSKVIPLAT